MYINTNSINNWISTKNSSENTSSKSDISNSFQAILDEASNKYTPDDTKRDDKEIIENMKKIVEDIKSVKSIGMIQEDIELLEKMLAKIKEEMDKQHPNNVKIDKMFDELEKLITKYEIKISGESITDADELDEKVNIKPEISDNLDFKKRLSEAKDDIKNLKEELKKATQI